MPEERGSWPLRERKEMVGGLNGEDYFYSFMDFFTASIL